MVKRLVDTASLRLLTHIRQDLFGTYPGGTTATTLSTRSGMLKKTVRVIPATQQDEDTFRGGISVGTKYAAVHFGKRGESTVIEGKGKMLTIPLPQAMNAQGVAKGSALDTAVFGDTFVRKNKNGNVIIYGKTLYTKGKKAGQAKGGIVPLFLLRKSVTVPVRIANEDLQAYLTPIVSKGLADIRLGLESSTALG